MDGGGAWPAAGPDGSYHLRTLAAGVYRLRFYDSSRRYKTEYYHNVSTINRATDITVNSGNLTTGIDAALAAAVLSNAGSLSVASSNQVLDTQTGVPIADARVTLFTVPDWRPRIGGDDCAPDTCESLASKVGGAAWSQPAPTELGEWLSPALADEVMELAITPTLNPQITTSTGRFQWQVPGGCWYVLAEADGYQSAVSPVVGASGELTELTLRLSSLRTIFLPVIRQ